VKSAFTGMSTAATISTMWASAMSRGTARGWSLTAVLVMDYSPNMDALLAAAADLWQATSAGDDLRLIGGLAMRLHVGVVARVTTDIDVVAMTSAVRQRLLDHLGRSGYDLGQSGGWWRAMREDPVRLVIDIADNPVVNPRTFEPVRLRALSKAEPVGQITVAVAGVDDLALLKLLAGRDQDLVDLLLLAGTCEVSAEALARTAAADDVERTLSGGALRARHALRSGWISDLVEQFMEQKPDEGHLARLDVFLAALERKGL
jgi:hypothetical protein